MPVHLTPMSHGTLVQGHTWKVQDEKALAELIARVALGHASHVAKILQGAVPQQGPFFQGAVSSAKKMLTVEAGEDPWQRDGWMFQVMSWLAAHLAHPSAILNPPHMRHAQKGFDGVQLEFDPGTGLSAVVIFEDKATDSPRDTIRDKVWPEFQAFERGDDTNVLIAEVVGLLERQPNVDADAVIKQVVWKNVRRFRVSITIGDAHASNIGHMRLFKDYDTHIPGDLKRRQGETFHVTDLRPWMSGLASKALAFLSAQKFTHV
jgi:hypothetical protein